MKWFRNLYVGETLKNERDALIREMDGGISRPDVYMITLAMNGRDLLDIRRTRALEREDLRKNLPMIVGLAKGQKEAKALVEQIVRDCLRSTGDVDLRSFLKE